MMEYRWDDIHAGLKHEFDAVFSDEDAETFARLSGDINPLHVDAAYAAGAGFKSPVLFGMLTSSLYSKLVGVYLPGKYALLQGMDLHFSSPVHAGERLFVAGEVVFLQESVSPVRGEGFYPKRRPQAGFEGPPTRGVPWRMSRC